MKNNRDRFMSTPHILIWLTPADRGRSHPPALGKAIDSDFVRAVSFALTAFVISYRSEGTIRFCAAKTLLYPLIDYNKTCRKKQANTFLSIRLQVPP